MEGDCVIGMYNNQNRNNMFYLGKLHSFQQALKMVILSLSVSLHPTIGTY